MAATMDDLIRVIDALRAGGVRFVDGLTSPEFAELEERFEIRFPPDLRAFLATAMPVSGDCYDWRHDHDRIEAALQWPLEGMLFDLEHNAFWLDSFGARPADPVAAADLVRAAVEGAPRLIPVVGHRYIPGRPNLAGNPVYSIVQTDIVPYGSNLVNHMHNEFDAIFKAGFSLTGPLREIELWSEVIRWNERQ